MQGSDYSRHALRVVMAVAIIAACFAAARPTATDELELDGIRLGMSTGELQQAGAMLRERNGGAIPKFVVGGIAGKRDGLRIEVDDGRLVMAAFTFRSADFPALLRWASNRYPDLLCSSYSDVGLGDGSTVGQRTCTFTTPYGQLRLSRYADDIDTGFLGIASTDWMQRYGGRQIAQ